MQAKVGALVRCMQSKFSKTPLNLPKCTYAMRIELQVFSVQNQIFCKFFFFKKLEENDDQRARECSDVGNHPLVANLQLKAFLIENE